MVTGTLRNRHFLNFWLKCIIHVSYVIWEGWPGWPGWPELTGVAGGLGGVAWGCLGWPKGWRVAKGMEGGQRDGQGRCMDSRVSSTFYINVTSRFILHPSFPTEHPSQFIGISHWDLFCIYLVPKKYVEYQKRQPKKKK